MEGKMSTKYIGLIIWLGLLILSWFYVQKVKRPESKPLAAWLIFVVTLSAAVILIFVGLSYLAASIGLLPFVDRPLGAALFLASVFVPAFLLAHWMMRKRATPAPSVD
jgi:FtsH-binding integral membrane protein